MPAPEASLTGDQTLAAVTQAMVAFHQRYHHREPVTAKTLMLGDDLLVSPPQRREQGGEHEHQPQHRHDERHPADPQSGHQREQRHHERVRERGQGGRRADPMRLRPTSP
jgi:hypothetical protein